MDALSMSWTEVIIPIGIQSSGLTNGIHEINISRPLSHSIHVEKHNGSITLDMGAHECVETFHDYVTQSADHCSCPTTIELLLKFQRIWKSIQIDLLSLVWNYIIQKSPITWSGCYCQKSISFMKVTKKLKVPKFCMGYQLLVESNLRRNRRYPLQQPTSQHLIQQHQFRHLRLKLDLQQILCFDGYYGKYQ